MRRLALPLAGLFLALLAVPLATAQGTPQEVEVGLHVINLGNYDTSKGTYVLDFYLWFRWNTTAAPAGFSPERFEFMNGRATARERLSDTTEDGTGMREVWFRVQANLYSEPRFESYPYDTQRLEVLFEDTVSERHDLRYVPLRNLTSVDPALRVSGWRIDATDVAVLEHSYPFGERYDRYVFSLTLSREPTSTTLKAFLPPLAFVIVSALAFTFHPSKVAQRLTLGTSMLISAVLFHISQIVSLPSLPYLVLYDRIMLSVYTFLLASLVVTTLIAVDEDYWKGSDHTREINRYGFLLSLGIPILTYLLLTYV